MSEFLDEPSLRIYRNELLADYAKPLSDQAQLVVSGADCVLAKPQEHDQKLAGFLISDIVDCTGQRRATVVSACRIIEGAGFLASIKLPRDSMVALLYGSSSPPNLYVPQERGGEQFFYPHRRLGSECTILTSIIHSLSPPRRRILEYMARLAVNENSFTRAALEKDFSDFAITKTLDLLKKAGVLFQHEEAYTFTERGQWLTSGLKAPEKPTSIPLSRTPAPSLPDPPITKVHEPITPIFTQEPVRPTVEATTQPPVLEKWIVQKVTTEYRTVSRDLLRALHQLVSGGVLEFSGESQINENEAWVYNLNPNNKRWLIFSKLVIDHTSPPERMAIAIWKGLGRLLYRKHLDPLKVAARLGLHTSPDIEIRVSKIIYPKLLREIANERRSKNEPT